MLNVSSWSIRNPIPAVMVFVLLTFGGVLAFNGMKVQNFPDIDLPTVTVTAALPGAAPAQLETDVARKIENSLATVQGLKHIYTKVQEGVVSVTANVAPRLMHEMCVAARSGDAVRAIQINNKLLPLHKNLFVEANPIPVKWALHRMGRIAEGIRLPLTPLAAQHHETVAAALRSAGCIN